MIMSDTPLQTSRRHVNVLNPTLTWRMLYAPISLFNSERVFNYEILPSEVAFDNLNEVSHELAVLTLPRTIYPDTVSDNETSSLVAVFSTTVLTFDTFFATQLIDIPKCFKKSLSLYRSKSFDLNSRLLNNIARHGRKTYIQGLYSRSIRTLVKQVWSLAEKQPPHINYSWAILYQALTSMTHQLNAQTFRLKPLPDLEYTDTLKETWERESYSVPFADPTHNATTQVLYKYNPIFSFYIRRVDKLKRKHSRGKSGKYSVTWKYVPEYKRPWVVIRWLAKDIKFQRARTLHLKLKTSFENLIFNKQVHLAYQLRAFVHKFVFYNYRKTLLKSLKSTT